MTTTMWKTFETFASGAVFALGAALLAAPAQAEEFTYQPPGQLVAGSGTGRVDYTVYVPGMRFPIEQAPAYPNSQVWGHGGMNGPGGGQCDANNYSYPWWDNYCETRTWDMPLCPGGQGHQGQDIRPATCENKTHWTVAAEAGTITNIGTYSVNLMTADGTQHRYLHMDPATLAVSVGDTVAAGDRLGLVSNAFGGTPTTIHLHYDIRRNVSPHGQAYIPTYMSLVTSYQDLIGQPAEPCGLIGPEGGLIDNDDACFQLLGNVGTWRTEDVGHGGSLNWTYAWEAPDPDGYARWSLHVEEPGDYELEVYIEASIASSARARYSLFGDGQQHDLRVDQGAASGWTSLGTFRLSGESGERLEIYDNSGEAFADRLQFVADALRLTRRGVEEPEVDAGEPDAGQPDVGEADVGQPDTGADSPDAGSQPDASLQPDAGDASEDRLLEENSCVGCSSTDSGGSSALMLLLMAGLLARRRVRRVA